MLVLNKISLSIYVVPDNSHIPILFVRDTMLRTISFNDYVQTKCTILSTLGISDRNVHSEPVPVNQPLIYNVFL